MNKKILAIIPNSKSKIVYKYLPSVDPRQRKPNISLAINKLDWQPQVNLDKGLQATVAYFRELLIKDLLAPGRSQVT